MSWNRGSSIPGASTRSWPSIYIPPWAGGEAPFEATKPRMTRAPVGLLPADPVAEGGSRDRHFHQLLRLLRLTENRTRKAGWPGDLGHCDSLLGHHRIDVLDHGHQLVHHLRLRYSKRGTMGATSASCSMVCRCTCSCGPGGSARLAGRLPPGSSSYNWKSTGWGGGVFRSCAV